MKAINEHLPGVNHYLRMIALAQGAVLGGVSATS
jgi:hypothetical protein